MLSVALRLLFGTLGANFEVSEQHLSGTLSPFVVWTLSFPSLSLGTAPLLQTTLYKPCDTLESDKLCAFEDVMRHSSACTPVFVHEAFCTTNTLHHPANPVSVKTELKDRKLVWFRGLAY